MPVEGELPSLGGATEWLNSPPLTPAGLRGNVVLVDFWTYTCINWLRTLPYVRAWADKYQRSGLVVIGVHTPEFDVRARPRQRPPRRRGHGVDYPVAVDSDYAIWTAFDNHYWPALYFVDAQGRIRHHQFGEGGYEQSEMIDAAAARGGRCRGGDQDLVVVDPEGRRGGRRLGQPVVARDLPRYERTEHFASPDGAVLDSRTVYAVPRRLRLNQWALAGAWTVKRQAIVLNDPGGGIVYRFHARDLHLVMGPPARGTPVRFRVLLDGQPPGAAHGTDVDEDGRRYGHQPRLYQLIRQPGPIAERTFQITFLDPGVQAYAFTFG